MDDAIDIAIIDRVMGVLNLPDDRPAVDPDVMKRRIDSVFSMLRKDVPSDFCKRVFELYFARFQATHNECLQAWALYYDFKSMASLYGLEDTQAEKVWSAGGLALTS